ncbi:hypothetical protein, partial [Francisella tularensis]|uniref:hypothetical protein n=1 Tax=Francisella tularensis TaxID=263 RepID=UPI002381BF96
KISQTLHSCASQVIPSLETSSKRISNYSTKPLTLSKFEITAEIFASNLPSESIISKSPKQCITEVAKITILL